MGRIVVLLCVGLLWLAGVATAAEVIEPRERSEAVRAALREAAELSKTIDKQPDLDRFHKLLQPIAGELPVVPVSEAAAEPVFRKLTLNKGGEKFDAFVFETPAAEGADAPKAYNLAWRFVMPAPSPKMVWYILPASGTMKGFETFDSEKNQRFEDKDLPQENLTISQELPGGRLKPGERYIIWFRFEDAQPHDVYAHVTLQPVE